jgi:pimeloyl-ACP methyl ester carboxylesterase
VAVISSIDTAARRDSGDRRYLFLWRGHSPRWDSRQTLIMEGFMLKITRYKNEYSLSYAEYGDRNGYPILIQHGLIASIKHPDLFERLIRLGTRLICIARPGYGESSPYVMDNIGEWANIVSVLIDKLELSQFDVLGMSSGAPYSYAIGCKFPGKARNIFILSGTPALFDETVLSSWPYGVTKNASIGEMQKLAYELFFSNLSPHDFENDDVKDSMMNDCFGIAQDLKIRCIDWGFRLSDVKENVFMRHSKADSSVPFTTAEMTSKLLPNCTLDIKENDVHFSNEVLNDFISTTMAGWYKK